jgi:hypothetical protein
LQGVRGVGALEHQDAADRAELVDVDEGVTSVVGLLQDLLELSAQRQSVAAVLDGSDPGVALPAAGELLTANPIGDEQVLEPVGRLSQGWPIGGRPGIG